MITYSNYLRISLVTLVHVIALSSLVAQDLDPRAYLWLPVKTNTLITGYSYSHGGVVTDPTLPIEDLEATVHGASLGYVHTFGLFGLTSSAMVAVPYSWAEASGTVVGQAQRITRSGLADSRMRLTVLVHGGPAAGVQEFIKAPKKTLIGISMSMGVPTGEFFSDKLINIGTHRWSFKPEVALSQPIGKRWLLDAYAGVWFFTTNYSFYPGTSKRSQEAMGSFQVHISYNITPRLWVALNSTYYVGGESAIDDMVKDDRQSNTRIGLTAVMPVGKSNSIKLAASTGAIVRVGQDFTTFSFGWQHSWFGKPAKEKATD
jgi:hypothetical protein